jgi:hypothetical protein
MTELELFDIKRCPNGLAGYSSFSCGADNDSRGPLRELGIRSMELILQKGERLERATGLEPATSTLARSHSTN